MFAGAFGLGFIGEDHFAHGVAAGDRGIEDRHDVLLGMEAGSFSLVRFGPKAIDHCVMLNASTMLLGILL